MISLVRDIVAVHGGHDGLLGLYGAFAYDLVFQFEDLEQKRALTRPTSATSCSTYPRIACWPMTASPAAAWC